LCGREFEFVRRKKNLGSLDARVLRATDAFSVRTAERVARQVGCSEDVAQSCLRRLHGRMLVEVDGWRPSGWLRTRHGDVALEHHADDA
jgi:hypothetical protein